MSESWIMHTHENANSWRKALSSHSIYQSPLHSRSHYFTTQISIFLEIWAFLFSLSFSFSREIDITFSQPWLLQADSNPSIFTGHNQISLSSSSALSLSSAFVHFGVYRSFYSFFLSTWKMHRVAYSYVNLQFRCC